MTQNLSSQTLQTSSKQGVGICFTPDVEQWRGAVSYAWQDQLRRGEYETLPVIGKDLCAGDVVCLAGTYFLVKLEAPLISSSSFGRAFTRWHCQCLNSPAQAVCTEQFFSQSVYRVLPK
jgi:hypothetical protein